MLNDLLYRLRALFRGNRLEAELDEEVRFHFEQQVAKNVREGMPQREAVRQARLLFGGVDEVKEECRDARGISLIESTWEDLQYAARTLAKSKGFASLAVITLALGVGANSAVFSLVYAVLWKPLPFMESDRLIAVGDRYVSSISAPGFRSSLPVNFIHAGPDIDGLEAIAGLASGPDLLRTADGVERISANSVTANFFDILRVPMVLGRNFTEQEQRERTPVALIGYGFWQNHFGGSPDVLDKTLVVSNYQGEKTLSIIGVTPAGFWLPRAADPDLWTLLSDRDRFDRAFLWDPDLTIGRLAPGADIGAVAAQLAAYRQGILDANEQPESTRTLVVRALRDDLADRFSSGLLLLLAAVGFVLLIACANLANLFLSRGIARRRELGVRAALGAGRRRLIRQLLAESGLVALFGGALGVAVAYGGVEFLRAIAFEDVPRIDQAVVDGKIVAATLALSLAAALLSSLIPAFHVSQTDLGLALQSNKATESALGQRLRDFCVVSEIALAVVVVVGAGLMVNTFLKLRGVDLGFQPEHLSTVYFGASADGHDEQRQAQFVDEALQALMVLPGVESVGLSNNTPLTHATHLTDIKIPGRDLAEDDSQANHFTVSPGYFAAMNVPLLRGRLFTESDLASATQVAIIDQTTASLYWPNQDAVGETMSVRFFRDWPTVEIIGVVDDAAQASLDSRRRPQIYLLPTRPGIFHPNQAVVRSSTELTVLAPMIRAALRQIDRSRPEPTIRPLAEFLEREFAQPRFYMLLLSSFAGLALLLAVVGLYGVVSYSVMQRTQEFGIRRALGGQTSDVLVLVLRRAVILTVVGLTIGIGSTFALSGTVKHLLYEVQPNDPATLLCVAALLLSTALLACYVPARRAARIDPLEALRYE